MRPHLTKFDICFIQGLPIDIQDIFNLILEKKLCCKNVQPGVQALISLANMYDQKMDEMVIRQEMMTRFGWERPHKNKRYKVWTFSE